ncbi:GyrI-like domain-containing protein [Agarivorans sp. 1_MG-2023]|uniref:AraC family transcriptional regulator n=1 Tax=Agarivorans sp. 1_MG-2023 TaxID=3062634 RepID=UPI0026E3407D|nr:AraC family transcriptional regulator [Agarivorans sp. 1_MG-2023]MDO6765250.1 AraC family transcriptional regulator [Agarivorans sp. 1_MG-2023]
MSKTNYHQKFVPVIRYLEKNYDQNLNLDEVAKLAHLSPYYFHRIFKAVTDETPADFLRRLKLEKAASQLFYHKEPVTKVALDFGFSSSQALAKAFRSYFAISPSAVRSCKDMDTYTQLLRDSKIGHLLRNNGHALEHASQYASSANQSRSVAMKTEHFDQKTLAYVRVTGPYGEGYDVATEKLYGWAGPLGLAKGESIFIYHDNPELTPADKCRTDVCLAVPSDVNPPAGIELQTLPSGQYASIRKTVTENSQYALFWQQLMTQVVKTELTVDNRPCFELYHHYDMDSHHADVSFCTSVKL